MDKYSVLVYDSGVGGINLLITLKKALPNFNYFYMSDSKNMPYGNKKKGKLFEIACENLKKVGVENFYAVFLACNTLTTNCLNMLKSVFPNTLFYGVKPKVVKSKNKQLLVCTYATASSSFCRNLKRDKDSYNVDIIPLQKLVCEIDNKILHLNNIDFNIYMSGICKDYERVYLGCTHFCFLKEKFQSYFSGSEINDGVCDCLMEFLSDLTRNDHTLNIFDHLNPKSSVNFIFCDQNRNKFVYEKILKSLDK